MKLSKKGASFVRAHEGFVGKHYLDPVGIPTIGIGFTWYSTSFREWWSKNKRGAFGPGATITRDEAEDALRYLVDREYGKSVNDFLGKEVPQHVFDGMVSPVFNLGAGSLEWKWANAAKRGDYRAAAEKLRVTGTTAKGKKLRGLVTRRIEEAELIENGDYTIGRVSSLPKSADTVLVRGERGDAVKNLQIDLVQLGYYSGVVDGIFGVGTEQAVMEYQKANDLKVDGFAGPNTLSKIQASIAASPVKKPSAPTKSRKGGIAALIAAFVAVIIGYAKQQGWF